MKSEKYLVTTIAKNRSRKTFWDPRFSLRIGYPVRWVLEKTDMGFTVREWVPRTNAKGEDHPNHSEIQGSSSTGEKGPARRLTLQLPVEILKHQDPIELCRSHGQSFCLKIELIKELSVGHEFTRITAHKTSVSDTPLAFTTRWIIYNGRKDWTLGYENLENKYRGFLLGTRIFTLASNEKSRSFRIKPFISGLTLNLKGKSDDIPLTAGKWFELSGESQVSNATLKYGPYWWKAIHKDESRIFLPDKAPPKDSEDALFQRTALSSVAATLILSFLLSLLPTVKHKSLMDLPMDIQNAPVVTMETKMVWIPKVEPPAKEESDSPYVEKKIADNKDDLSEEEKEEIEETLVKSKPAQGKNKKVMRSGKVRAVQRSAVKKGPTKSQRAELVRQQKLKGVISELSDLVNSKSIGVGKKAISQNEGSRQKSRAGLNKTAGFSGVQKTTIKLASIRQSTDGDVDSPFLRGKSKGFVNLQGSNDIERQGHSRGKKTSSFVNIQSGSLKVEKGLTKDEVGAVIKRHLSEIRYCHEMALLGNPKLEGKLTYEFLIDKRGSVSNASLLASTFGRESALETCLHSRLISWFFPKPKGGISVSVTYPFLFKTLGRD